MSGHNKWSQIKRQKGVEDGKKSKVFGVLAKTIALEARKAGGDRNAPGLRVAIEKARSVNMPNENIDRAIKNGLGLGDKQLEEVLYEAYGPGGVALIIEGITNNKNRTSQELKHLLSLYGGTLATPGAVLWAFEKVEGNWKPKTETELGEEDKTKLSGLLETLTENEDVKNMTTNLCAS